MKKKNNPVKILILTVVSFVYLIPIFVMVLGSFKTKGEAVRFDLSLPEKFQWANYEYVIENGHVITGYMNSILITTATTLIVLIFGALAGIYVGRRKGKLVATVYNYFILGLTVSLQLATTFALLKSLNIYGTRLGVILINAGMQMPFTVMTFSSFIKGIPSEIDEAAIIDGCGSLKLIFRVLLPVMKPIMVTNLIVTAINTWNNFMVPLFYLDSAEKWPIPLMVYNFFGRYARNWNYVFVMLVITILPIVILYLCLQKYIVEGMTSGSVKG
jgi:raffinose/stachyose/melibiose transport system permease protein